MTGLQVIHYYLQELVHGKLTVTQVITYNGIAVANIFNPYNTCKDFNLGIMPMGTLDLFLILRRIIFLKAH